MKYGDFINELKTLLEEAQTLFNVSDTHQNPRFRKWRHQLTTTISIIEDQGYEIDCDIASRIFQVASYGSVSTYDQITTYNRELQDTINELEIIIQYFDKYGDPKARETTSIPEAQLEWPQKITLSWLFSHAPVGLWVKAGGFLLATFILGVAIGQSKLYEEMSIKFNAAEKPNNKIQSTPKSGATD